MTIEHWLLPDGVEDVLPETARKIEYARRSLIDLFGQWGYRHVMPAKLEFLESLSAQDKQRARDRGLMLPDGGGLVLPEGER